MNTKYNVLLVLLLMISCKTKLNQYVKVEEKVQKRHGKWREEYSSDNGSLIAIGKYNKGEKVGTWKTTFEGRIYQKDKIRKNITKTKYYFHNGKLMEIGQSRFDISKQERHWYYFGDWKYYNEEGKLLYVKKYEDGKKIDSISYIK